MAVVTISNITIQPGTTRTLQCSFKWNATGGYAYPSSITYKWMYRVGTSSSYSEYVGSSETLSYSTKIGNQTQQTSYTVPDNAFYAVFSVQASSQTHVVTKTTWVTYKKKNGKKAKKKQTKKSTVSWFTGNCYTCKGYSFTTLASITTPSITASIKGLKLTVTLENYSLDTYTQNKYLIVSRNGSKSSNLPITGGYATTSYNCTAGEIDILKAQVMVQNVGYSEWSSEQRVEMPPDKPVNLTVKATDKTQCLVSWEYPSGKDSSSVNSYTIEYATDKDTFNYSGQASSASTGENNPQTSWLIGDLSQGNTYYFRVKATSDSGDSEWSDISDGLILGTKPTAPTTWSDVSSVLLGDSVILFWIHNSSDGSYQRSAIIDINGTEYTWTNTEKDDDDQPYYTLDTSAISSLVVGSSLVWKVKTKGVVDEYSDWSVERTITVCSAPSVKITMDSTITTYPINIVIDSDGGNGVPTTYQLSIKSDSSYTAYDDYGDDVQIMENQVIWSDVQDTNDTSLSLSLKPTDVTLLAGQSYTFTAVVASSNGLRNNDSAQFSCNIESNTNEYDLNAYTETFYNSDCPCLSIRPYIYKLDTDTGEYDQSVVSESGFSISIYRINFDGTYTEIESDINPEKAVYVIDPHPILTTALYKLVATKLSDGTMISYTIEYPIDEPLICLTWDEDYSNYANPETTAIFVDNNSDESDDSDEEDEEALDAWPEMANDITNGETLTLQYNIDTSEDSSIDASLVEYAGRKHPVSYYGTQVGQTASWSCVIESDDEYTISQLRKLQVYTGDVYCRNPNGVGYWANIKVSFSKTHADLTMPVSLSLTRVEGGK